MKFKEMLLKNIKTRKKVKIFNYYLVFYIYPVFNEFGDYEHSVVRLYLQKHIVKKKEQLDEI